MMAALAQSWWLIMLKTIYRYFSLKSKRKTTRMLKIEFLIIDYSNI